MNQYFSPQDIKENKVKAGLGYMIFFLPFIICKDSKLGRHCANQGLLLMITEVVLTMLLSIFTGLPLIGWAFSLVLKLVEFAAFLIGLLCFINLTTNERAVELPIIGKFRIIT